MPGGGLAFAEITRGAASRRHDGSWEVGEFHWK
jgi:surface antigen